jgi:hypothetical protein
LPSFFLERTRTYVLERGHMFEQQDELQERRLQHQLEIQSMQIEHVFNRHQVDAHVAGGTVKPR